MLQWLQVSYLLQSHQTSVDQEGSGQSFGPFVTDLVLSQAARGKTGVVTSGAGIHHLLLTAVPVISLKYLNYQGPQTGRDQVIDPWSRKLITRKPLSLDK